MKNAINIAERKPVWVALSEIYLDTELQDADFTNIALTISKSPYGFEEVRQIDKYEVFPVLYTNLLSVAGEWAGFNEEWLIDAISDSINKRNKANQLVLEASYASFKWMYKEAWEKLERKYLESK